MYNDITTEEQYVLSCPIDSISSVLRMCWNE